MVHVETEEAKAKVAAKAKAKGRGRRKVFIVVASALFLVLGSTSAAYFTGLMDPLIARLGDPHDLQLASGGANETVFYDLPEILVNLPNVDRRSTLLKIRVSLELGSPRDVPRVVAMMPRVLDSFQVYLRELRIDDLEGTAGIYRLRSELHIRAAAFVSPATVNTLLFREIQVQ